MSFYAPDEIWFLRQTVQSIQQELGGLARENIQLRGDVATLTHRCNDLENASVSDLDSLKSLEEDNARHEKNIINLKNLFLKLRGFQAKDYFTLQTVEKRMDEIDTEAIIETMTMKKLHNIATSTAEQVLMD
jgi:hypothetical protein